MTEAVRRSKARQPDLASQPSLVLLMLSAPVNCFPPRQVLRESSEIANEELLLFFFQQVTTVGLPACPTWTNHTRPVHASFTTALTARRHICSLLAGP